MLYGHRTCCLIYGRLTSKRTWRWHSRLKNKKPEALSLSLEPNRQLKNRRAQQTPANSQSRADSAKTRRPNRQVENQDAEQPTGKPDGRTDGWKTKGPSRQVESCGAEHHWILGLGPLGLASWILPNPFRIHSLVLCIGSCVFGFKSPLQFDQYTLNHSAFVGMQEVAWVNEFEQELERREVFVKKGTIQYLANSLQSKKKE